MLITIQAYELAKEIVVEKSVQRLHGGMAQFENEIRKANAVAGIISSSSDFKALLRVKGMPESAVYPNITNLQKHVRQLCVTMDTPALLFLMFRNTPIFISNYMATDDYHKVYPLFLSHEHTDVEDWRERILDFSYGNRLFAQEHIIVAASYGDSFDGILCILNTLGSSDSRGISQNSALGAVFDVQMIVDGFVFDDQMENGFFLLIDSDGKLLTGQNFSWDPSLHWQNQKDAIDPNRYFILETVSHELGVMAVHGIDMRLFNQNIRFILTMVMAVSGVGLFLIITMSMVYSLRETHSMEQVVALVSSATGNPIGKNEYRYLRNAFFDLEANNRRQKSRIEKLDSFARICALENLLINGCYTAKEKDEIIALFGHTFHAFCLVIFLVQESSRNRHAATAANAVLEIESEFLRLSDGRLAVQSVSLQVDEVAFIVSAGQGVPLDVQQVEGLAEAVIRSISGNGGEGILCSAGISPPAQGVENARPAYQQAKNAVFMNYTPDAAGVYIVKTVAHAGTGKSLDMGMLSRCHNMILVGDPDAVGGLFREILANIENLGHTEEENMQLFFDLRRAVGEAREAILGGKIAEGHNALTATPFPEYRQGDSHAEIVDRFLAYSLYLCDLVAGARKSNNEKLKRRILDYVQENYQDADLSAASISSELWITEKYVFTLVKEATGKSLSKYVEGVRLDRAEHLLRTTDLPNAKIFPQCGFGGENTFYRAFSRRHGVSPSAWRAAMNPDQEAQQGQDTQ